MIKRNSIKQPLIFAALAFIIAFFAVVGNAAGQGRDDIQAALEKTDNLLEQARDIVREAGSDRGSGPRSSSVSSMPAGPGGSSTSAPTTCSRRPRWEGSS